MNEVSWRTQQRTTMVCIDEYSDGNFSGRLHHTHMDEGISFHGMMDFLKKTEAILDATKFPQSFSMNRFFRSPPEADMKDLCRQPFANGKVATFSLRILFRQNTSWQGSVSWIEGRQEESFRSVLELLFLMDSAMADSSAGAV